jgi:hypothetical protein
MISPDLYNLGTFDFEFFGSLTYKGKVPPPKHRRTMWFAFVYELSKKCQCKPSDLLWVRREESGEQFGRLHQHFLLSISKPGLHTNRITWSFVMRHLWEKVVGGGICRIRPYNWRLSGAAYAVKDLSGGDAYELGKFKADTAALTFSHRLESLMKRKAHGTKVVGYTQHGRVIKSNADA